MAKRVLLSCERDLPMMRFLWRWKISSTLAIASKFFPTCSVGTAYGRLQHLSHGGYLKTLSDKTGKASVWSLTKKGFETVRPLLPPLKAETFQSEHILHDVVVSAAHLGNWLLTPYPELSLFSEQELRSFEPEFFPDWVPEIPNHRPDGYWRISNQTIALEVELSPKVSSWYQDVGAYYSYGEQVSKVIWFAKDQTLARRIVKYTSDHRHAKRVVHNIALIGDFFKKGWGCNITLGPDAESSVSKLLQDTSETSSQHVWTSPLLNLRKSPHRSTTCVDSSIENYRY